MVKVIDNIDILLTNDDGIQANGLKTLQKAVASLGNILVLAPNKEQSATSRALTIHKMLYIEEHNENVFSINGTPTDSILVAYYGLLKNKNPKLLISGINHGPNMGDDVTYSGTVAAAMEGTAFGIPSIAISLATWDNFKFEHTIPIIYKIISSALKKKFPADTLLNINIPPITTKIKGIKITRLGKRIYNDAVTKHTNPSGKEYFWIGGVPSWEKMKGCDFEAIEQGYVSITPLHLDLTNYKTFDYLSDWEEEF